MRVAEFSSLAGPSGISIAEHDDPSPSSGEVIVDVEVASLNRHDLRILQGKSDYVDESELPFVSGLDLVGEVEDIGDDVANVARGDQVLLYPVLTCGRCRFCRKGPENQCQNLSLFHGAFAERAVVRAEDLIHLPETVTPTEAVGLPSAYTTAWRTLERAGVTAGDRVLIPGATGGVGVATVQLAGVRGARTVGTSRSPTKLNRLAKLGADQTVVAETANEVASGVKDLGPFDIVVNHLGGGYLEAGLKAIRTGGTMVVCGGTAGFESTVDVARLYRSHADVLGSSVGTKPDLERVLELVADRKLSPAVEEELPLEEAERAFRLMQDQEAIGKILLRP
jgi:NADPH2:quinone reductase